jgi:guanylate kinase
MQYVLANDPNIHLTLTDVSRQPRPGEQDGVDYYFHSRADMLAGMRRGVYVQVAPTVNGDIYASRAASYTVDGCAIMAIIADAMPVLRSLPFRQIRTICIVPPSYEAWQLRIAAHHFTKQETIRRLQEARRSLLFAAEDKQSKLLMNDELASSCDMFLHLVQGTSLTRQEQQNQEQGRRAVPTVLHRLDQELERLSVAG